jgi:methylenetetrahydrofolate reductase (NADPH)
MESMRLKSIFATGKPALSFEVYPPKTPAGYEAMYASVGRLMEFGPAFFSCTYGAGGSTQGPTLDICSEIMRRHSVPVMAHLTCVGSTVAELESWLSQARDRGIANIMALRGDPPQGQESFIRVQGGLGYANELVDLIRARFPGFGIGVGGYPEVHQEAADAATDLVNLKRKVDAGADAVVTQLFYDNDDFFRFRDKCHQAGIRIPIVPGLLPIVNFPQVKRITSLCKARIPSDLFEKLEAGKDNPEAAAETGIRHAAAQYAQLTRAGVPGVHFYVLNQSEAARRVLEAAGASRG